MFFKSANSTKQNERMRKCRGFSGFDKRNERAKFRGEVFLGDVQVHGSLVKETDGSTFLRHHDNERVGMSAGVGGRVVTKSTVLDDCYMLRFVVRETHTAKLFD